MNKEWIGWRMTWGKCGKGSGFEMLAVTAKYSCCMRVYSEQRRITVTNVIGILN